MGSVFQASPTYIIHGPTSLLWPGLEYLFSQQSSAFPQLKSPRRLPYLSSLMSSFSRDIFVQVTDRNFNMKSFNCPVSLTGSKTTRNLYFPFAKCTCAYTLLLYTPQAPSWKLWILQRSLPLICIQSIGNCLHYRGNENRPFRYS